MEQYAGQTAYVTLKDQFKISKKKTISDQIAMSINQLSEKELEKINIAITNKTKYSQWPNYQAVIDWFKSIPNKTKARFIKFDIVEFFTSITEKLLDNAVSYAQTVSNAVSYAQIILDITQLSKQSRKSLLLIDGSIWMKKSENALFDATMAPHGEICGLVGATLSNLSNIIDQINIGLYRDDELSVIGNGNRPKPDRLRKDVIVVFHNEGLKIIIDTNLTTKD